MELFDFEQDKAVEKNPDTGLSAADQAELAGNHPIRPSEDGQSLLQTIIMILGGVILVILLVLFARWVYHKVHHNTDQTPSTTNNQPSRPAKTPSQSGAKPQPSGPSSSPSPSPSQDNNPLPNSGPGNVAAVFAASTLAAAGLHFIISLRRFSKGD